MVEKNFKQYRPIVIKMWFLCNLVSSGLGLELWFVLGLGPRFSIRVSAHLGKLQSCLSRMAPHSTLWLRVLVTACCGTVWRWYALYPVCRVKEILQFTVRWRPLWMKWKWNISLTRGRHNHIYCLFSKFALSNANLQSMQVFFWLPVNSSHGHVVTRSTRHRSTRHRRVFSQSHLITRSSRHTVISSQARIVQSYG